MAEARYQLCRHIISNQFGEVVETVCSLMVKLGRIPLRSIVRESGLTPKKVFDVLVTLIQHGMITHAESIEGGNTVAYYSPNLHEILRRARIGIYLKVLHDRLDPDGFKVANLVLQNGVMTAKQIKRSMGITAAQKKKLAQLQKSILTMVRERILIAVQPKDLLTKSDRLISEEKDMKSKESLIITANKLKEIRRQAREKLDYEYDDSAIVGMASRVKRKATGDVGSSDLFQDDLYNPSKMHIAGDSSDVVEDDAFFRLNFDKLDVLLRNQQIIQYFARKINTGASAVMKHILRLTEEKVKSCRETSSNRITANQIVHSVPADIPLKDTMVMDFEETGNRETRHIEYVHAYIELLGGDPSGILAKRDERGSGEYQVDFQKAFETLRNKYVDTFIQEHFGSVATRITRVLRAKNKLEEKQVAQFAMLPVGVCRSHLLKLFNLGLVDLHEVAKSSDRFPARTLYFWYINYEKQLDSMLSIAYKQMANLYIRLGYEKSSRSRLLAKMEREDVKLDPSLLGPSEVKAIEEYNKITQILEASLIRIELVVLTLRDSLVSKYS
ncbi:RNA polymerase III subunit C82 [Mycoemilia scoparia]|uniref:DNA-directed RNA polymerase III subunit RPC3 n=1 Tax=Mycoemilia scoparia TaxID=417184 RepID=A0A9W8A412_9FUNG|nr:RNA polymerase III subunit C82 [Mycoemilia scoparia]